MIKINFKQPKYIFPLVIFVPLCALIYFVMQTFGGQWHDGERGGYRPHQHGASRSQCRGSRRQDV